MPKYIERNIEKIIVAVIVLVIHYIREFIKFKRQRKARTNHQPDYDEANHEDYFPLPGHKPKKLVTPIRSTVAAIATLQHPLSPLTPSIHHKLMATPAYPGIKKLVLPAQEQDPYKLYQTAYPKQRHRLNHLLGKYNTTQQAIIIHAIFTPKSQI